MTENTTALLMSKLDPHQKEIEDNESRSIVARWEFGRVLRAQIPEGKKQLPTGLREQVATHYHVDPTEITRRMQLAREYPTREELEKACIRCNNSWRRIIAEELIKRQDGRSQKQSAWGDRAKARLDKVITEAGEGDGRRDELVALLQNALAKLTEADMKVAA